MLKYPVVYDEYNDLLTGLLEEFDVDNEDTSKVVDFVASLAETQFSSENNKESIVTLQVDREGHSINWSGKKGRIFELVGTNHRNKTSTLVYLSTLLGFDWDAAEPYIGSDKKIIHQASGIMQEISKGVKAFLCIENNSYRFEVNVQDAVASVVRWDKINGDHAVIQDVSLYSELDWREYRNKLNSFFDVQVVGSGRDFVTQVGFEEASNLALFCEQVSKYITTYNQLLQAEKPRINPRIIASQKIEVEQKYQELLNQKKQTDENLKLISINIDTLINDRNTLNQLLENNTLIEYLELEDKRKKIETITFTLSEKKVELLELDEQHAQYIDIIQKQTDELEQLEACIDDLKNSFNIIKESLSIPKHVTQNFSDALSNRDISQIVSVGGQLWVDEKSKDAHSLIANQNFRVSLKTKIIGMEYFSTRIENLSELKLAMVEAEKNAVVLQSIKDKFDTLFTMLNKLTFDSTESYLVVKQNIPVLVQVDQDALYSINKLAEEIHNLEKNYKYELESFASPTEFFNKYAEIKSLIIEENFIILDEIANKNNLNINVNIIPEIDAAIIILEKEKKETEFKQAEVKRFIETNRARKKKLDQDIKNIEGGTKIESRTISMLKCKTRLDNISEYINHKKQFFEAKDASEKAALQKLVENNEKLLNERFEQIINLINNRIKMRCPIAFINTERGIEKRKVLSYDFLKGDYDAEGIPDSSKFHGGITSSMTVYGLATKKTGAELGSILLVDEWGDIGAYKEDVYDVLAEIGHLSMAIFVYVDLNKAIPDLEMRR